MKSIFIGAFLCFISAMSAAGQDISDPNVAPIQRLEHTIIQDVSGILRNFKPKKTEEKAAKQVKIPYEYQARYNADCYLIDTIRLSSTLIVMEKSTNLEFIKSFDKLPESLDLKGSTADLLDDGWSLFYSLHSAVDKYLENTTLWRRLWDGPGHIGVIGEYKRSSRFKSRKYDVYTLEFPPDCYMLLLVKGRVFNRFALGHLDYYWGECQFKDPEAYYPLYYAIYTDSLPGIEKILREQDQQ